MSLNYLNVRIKQNAKTAAEWQLSNPVLLSGEIGIESDTGYMKAGDGSTPYNSLEYLKQPLDPVVIEIELLPGNWSSNKYQYNNAAIQKDSVIFMDLPMNTSTENYIKLQEACIVPFEQNDGYIIFQALGVAPATSVFIKLVIM